jgi:hypothetical protein
MQERPYKALMKYWTAKPAANKTPSTAATKSFPRSMLGPRSFKVFPNVPASEIAN